MANELVISELLQEVAKIKKAVDKKKYLIENESRQLKTFLKGSFDKSLEFNLPKGAPPYTPNKESKAGFGSVSSEFRFFAKGYGGDRLPPAEREGKFIKVLETVSPEEAELILLMKDKKLTGKYKGLTKKLVSEAFPNLIKQWFINQPQNKEDPNLNTYMMINLNFMEGTILYEVTRDRAVKER